MSYSTSVIVEQFSSNQRETPLKYRTSAVFVHNGHREVVLLSRTNVFSSNGVSLFSNHARPSLAGFLRQTNGSDLDQHIQFLRMQRAVQHQLCVAPQQPVCVSVCFVHSRVRENRNGETTGNFIDLDLQCC